MKKIREIQTLCPPSHFGFGVRSGQHDRQTQHGWRSRWSHLQTGKAPGVYKVAYPPPWGETFIESVVEEYQVVKRGRKYHGCGEK